ncbi:MAG: sulfatase-like hydrolase/transferase [Parvularculaceae bacterium]|nr:sulfatase-like hydrolase/transferase [Parvularculaceae bacterium]
MLESPARTRRFAGCVAVLLACVMGKAALAANVASPPNMIFIMADDLGYADLGVFGSHHISTPNLDQLARDGLKMTQGYANSAVCSPSRAALLTGKYQQRFLFGLEEPAGPNRAAPKGLQTGGATIASVLQEQGYYTALIGKWHLGPPPESGPIQQGYDYFYGLPGGAADYFLHRAGQNSNSGVDGLYQNNSAVTREGYLTRIFADETIDIIERSDARKPFFISLHFNAPHWPWQGPHDEGKSVDRASLWDKESGTVEKYAEMVESMDANIGRIMAALQEKGIAENTIVIFTSDNGGERFSDTWPLVGVKGELLEGGIRVPVIVRWPAKIAPGQTSDQVIASMDFAPTLLAAAGGKVEKRDFDGVNLLPQIIGDKKNRERTLYWRFRSHDQAAVRRGDFKYVRIAGEEFLFNVAEEPRERANLKSRRPELLDELRGLYEKWDDSVLPYPDESFSEDVTEGYVDRY